MVHWWTNGGLTDAMLELSRDGGNTWETISASVPDWTPRPTVSYDVLAHGEFCWPVTDGGQALPQIECIIRLTDAADGDPVGTSEPFAIRPMQVLHVDASAPAGGDGLTWATAFQHPRDAIAVPPAPGDEVWVAAGTYNELAGRVVTIPAGVRAYGGFAGTESALGDRDWRANPTVLDARDATDASVVVVDVTTLGTVVDGFKITGGNRASSEGKGGGIRAYSYNQKSDLTVRNCIITANSVGESGGGLWVYVEDLALEDCVISANVAGLNGGGLYYRGGTSVAIVGCLFANNTAVGGGGVYYQWGTVALRNCTFTGNAAGAISPVMQGTPGFDPGLTVRNCILWSDSPQA